MKTKIISFMIAGLLSLLSFSASAQDETPGTPPWVVSGGYWIVEGNLNSPLEHSIRFYNDQHVLIGRKDISGVKLDIRKKKTKMMLKEALESSLIAWEKNRKEGNQEGIARSTP